ncbi:MAG TPA: YceI family protein [Actinomycetota bacterium]|nr:YceI family protein [Actinomycetota bacterium]
MRRRRPIWFVAGAIILAIVGVGGVLALRIFGGDAPAEAALTSDQDTAGSGGSAQGSWTVDMTSGSLDDATSTFAGYRIQEEVVGVGANTAVGRTKDVTGTLMIDGTAITSLSVEVDMTTLVSDDDRRDGQLRTRGLETDTFPTATFQLTEPIEFAEEPAQGETLTTEAIGELTVHGVAREVTVPVEARWTGDQIEVVASFDIALADYEIDPPTGFLVLSVADQGTIELHLLFARA